MPTADYSITPNIFERVHVDYLVRGTARISWELGRTFNEPLPYVFQLQVSHAGLSAYSGDGDGRADDWLNVGNSVTDTFFAEDATQRLFGKTADLHYRVKLTTGTDTVYYSDPVSIYGDLDKHDWTLVKELLRKENLRHVKQVSVRGFLLKAKRYGPLCPNCLDPLTQEVTDSHCEVCYGTGFSGGYFAALPNVYVDVTLERAREALNPQLGTTKEVVIQGRMLAEPQIYSLDLWVADKSDLRYYIHPVGVASQHRGVPIVLNVELRLIPYSDIAYKVPLGS